MYICGKIGSLTLLTHVFFTLTGAQELEQRLPPLDDYTMGASFGNSSCHSPDMQNKRGAFHASGETWSDIEIANYFLKGIFQHYVHQICGLHMVYHSNSEYYRKIFAKEVLNVEDAALGKDLGDLVNLVLKDLRNNQTFVGIGVWFHRNKILLEKANEKLMEVLKIKGNIEKKLTEKPSKKHQSLLQQREKEVEEMSTLIYSMDRLCTDQQACFYYWLKGTLDHTLGAIKNFYAANNRLPEIVGGDIMCDGIPADVANTQPEFLHWPAYKEVVEQALLVKPFKLGNDEEKSAL